MILDEILNYKTKELAETKIPRPLASIIKIASAQPEPLDLAKALKGREIKIIAEVKKASPSRGVLRADFNPTEIAEIYAANGAAAISVLTESGYFQGSLEHLKAVRRVAGNRLPLIRKDFIFDPYQVYETRASGGDALLLITAILTPEKLDELISLSHILGMKCLVEVHNENELQIALRSKAEIIGINNRDLTTFQVDIFTTKRLRPLIPADRIVVSESGIKTREDITKLHRWGVNAALIGETLMTAADIAKKLKELL